MPIKIAILGGGMGSLAAAWRLTETPADRANHEVTVYQRDWLLGGKGASTRNDGIANGKRIEEHGIHLLLGFYNRALHLLRSAYDELRADPNIPPFDEVIEPWDWVWMGEQHPPGTWQPPWRVQFPSDPGVVPGESGAVPTPGALVAKAAARFSQALDSILGISGIAPAGAGAALEPLVNQILGFLPLLPRPAVESLFDLVASLIDALVRMAWALARPLLHVAEVRHAWIAVYLFGTNLSGVLRDRVLLDGPDVIDGLDYRAWLRLRQAVDAPAHVGSNAPPVQALYDLAFSRQVGLAAGVSLVAIGRMVLGYEGHFLYRMKGGMGEVVFAPLYHALAQRGVEFRFGHEATQLVAGVDGGVPVLQTIHFSVPGDAEDYDDPTVVVTGSDGVAMRAWPSEPPVFTANPTSQLSLERGNHFDVAVLGISVGGLTPALVQTLRDARPAFAAMIDHATHVGTQSMQLWMKKTGAQLGWPDPQDAMLISYERRFNSWVDMTHLLPREQWPAEVRSLHYLCDELRAGEGTTEADVKQNAIAWLQGPGAALWPGFDWNALYHPGNPTGTARMDFQYFRANVEGSDRYVTVGPGSVQHRLAPGASGFRNLALAGDWVLSELSAGCLEAATSAGLGAGQAIRDGTVQP